MKLLHSTQTQITNPTWEHFVAPMRGKVLALFLRRGLNRDEAEDLTQEVLLRSVRFLKNVGETAAVQCWLRKVAATVLADCFRTTAGWERSGLIGRQAESVEGEEDRQSPTYLFSATMPHPDDVVQAQSLCQALQTLSPRERTILTLHYVEGYAYEEIAGALQMSVGAVKMAASRACQRVRATCNPEDL